MSAEKVFSKLGVKSVTMDDISRELGISKKTLYQFVEDKNDLVKQCFSLSLKNNCSEMESLYAIENPLEEVFEIMKYMSRTMKQMNPLVMYEIRKYYVESWALFENYKYEYLLSRIKNNLEKGVKKGYYLKKLNVDIISRIHIETVMVMLGEQWFSNDQYSFNEIYITYMQYHLRGICTPMGTDYLESRLKEISFY